MEENYDMRDVLLSDQASKEQKNANLKRILTAIAILFVLLLIILIIMKSISSGNINDEKTIVMPSESEINKVATQKSQEQNLTKPQTEPVKQQEPIENVTSNLDTKPSETNMQNASQPNANIQAPLSEPSNQTQSAPVYKETIILKANDDKTHKLDVVEPKKEQNEPQKVVTDLIKESAKSTVVVTADKKQSEEVKQHNSQKQKKADEKIAKESKKTTNLDKTDKKAAHQKDEKPKSNLKEKEQKTSKNENAKQDKKTQISKNEVEEKSSKNAKMQKQTNHKQEHTEKISGWLQIRSMSGHNANIKDDPIYGKISSMKYKLENVEVKGEKRTRVLVPYSNADERAKLKAQFPGAW